MLGSWRVQLCAAQALYEQGRLDAARQMLLKPPLCEFRQAQQLLVRVAEALARRAQERLAVGLTTAGLRDLTAAAAAGATEGSLQAARRALAERLAGEAQSLLAAGDPHAALQRLEALGRQEALDVTGRKLLLAARHWQAAEAARRQGRLTDALALFQQAAALHPQCAALQSAAAACQHAATRLRTQLELLHGALLRNAWPEAFAAAQSILEICPEHPAAAAALSRAWQVAGLGPGANDRQVRAARLPDVSTRPPKRSVPQVHNGHARGGAHLGLAQNEWSERAELGAVPEELLPIRRFMLWIDGVGGYLVCEADSVVIGQPDSVGSIHPARAQAETEPPHAALQQRLDPAGAREADVPILADLSRRHARIRRLGEDYLLDPFREVRINKRPVKVSTLLTDGAELELSPGVRLRFRRPHPLCATARLEFLSRHRTHPPADAVLLAAGTCILGPEPRAHVVCSDWQRPVLLFRLADGWHVRCAGRFQVDGAWAEGEAAIGPRSQIMGEEFSFYLEPL